MNLNFWLDEILRLYFEGMSFKKASNMVHAWRCEYEKKNH